jgi:hypothetical protein
VKIQLAILASLIALFTSGCVVGRRTLPLDVPTQASYPPIKGTLYLAPVTADGRLFLNNPSDPAIASVDGDVINLTPAQKAGMISRQRNSYGQMIGDVALPEGESVLKVTRNLFMESLKRRGYSLSDDPASANSAVLTVDEFWAWDTAGMFSIKYEARVYCSITLKRGDALTQTVIKGYGINHGQMASDGNWQLVYQRAFEDFLIKSDAELKKAGL